jgi:hypothetical protein
MLRGKGAGKVVVFDYVRVEIRCKIPLERHFSRL